MNKIKAFLAILAIVAGISSCTAQPKPAKFEVLDFEHATILGPLADSVGYAVVDSVILCDEQVTGSIFYDSAVFTLTLKGGNLPEPIVRVFDNLGSDGEVLYLKDKLTGGDAVAVKLRHLPTSTEVVFIETLSGVIRLSHVKLECDEL